MKGQQFTTFKLLIGAVIGAALLAVVMSVVTNLSYPYSGFEITYNLMQNAKTAPGQCFSIEKVIFKEDEVIAASSFKDLTVSFHGSGSSITCSLTSCTVNMKLTIPIAIKCSTFTTCDVWFGKKVCA